jgi:hypothetical protein
MSVSGKFLSAFLNDEEIADNFEWDVEEGGEVLDRTVGSHGGKEYEDVGVTHTHITVNGYYDILTGNTSGIRREAVLTDLGLYVNRGDSSPAFYIGEAIVVRFRLRGQVRGRMEWTAEIHSRGDVVTYTAQA